MADLASERTAYHHGDLPRVLVAQATEVLNERGVAGFSLREVARRADVAVAAPSHHFGNVSGLLTAVAVEGFRKLVAGFDAVLAKKLSPEESLIEICESYVDHYRENPGPFSIMFRGDLLNDEDPTLQEVRPHSLQMLRDAVRLAIAKDASEERVELVANTLWSTMHGLVTLRKNCDKLDARVSFAARSILAGSDVDI